MEVARTPLQRERGLMHRRSLPEDEGMLFVFDRPVRHAFWMKDTRIPLSLAFLGPSGRIIEIQEMTPFDTTLHLPLAEYSCALEMNRGWFERNRIGVGDSIGLGAAAAPAAPPPPDGAPDVSRAREWWPWAAVVLLAMLMLETWLATRRPKPAVS